MREITWLLRFLRPYIGRLALAVLLGYLAVAANVGLMGTSGYLIAAAALHPVTILLLWTPIVGVRFFGISRSVFRYLERLVSHDLTFRILAQVRSWFFERIEHSGSNLLNERQSADVLAAAVSDVESLQNLYLRVLAPPLIAVCVGIMSFGFIARYSLLAGFLFGLCYLVAGGLIPWFSMRIGRTAGAAAVDTRSSFQTQLGNGLSGMTELLVDGRAEGFIERLESEQTALSKAIQKGNSVSSTASGLFVFFTNLSVWTTLLILIPLVHTNQVQGVNVPSLLFIVLASFEAVMPLPAAMQALAETQSAARRIRDIAGAEDTADTGHSTPGDSVEGAPVNRREVALNAGTGALSSAAAASPGVSRISTVPLLEVQDLYVRYAPGEPFALQGLDLEIKPKQRIAIVGESGSGKTTLVNILLRLCTYERGSVLLGGHDTSRLTDEEMRDLFAVVPQRAFLFHVSIADNLRLGKPGAGIEELRRAAEMAQISDLIDRLPDGYDTLVGEDGTRFSGGERQRLALARALLRDAPIFLLDEPTKGLDAITEARFLDALWSGTKGRSVLYITHQLSGLEAMDSVAVLHRGRIVEQAPFSELMQRQNSLLRQLWHMERGRLA